MQSTKSAQTGQSGNVQLPLLLRGDFDIALPAAPPSPPSPPRENPPAEPPGEPPRSRRKRRNLPDTSIAALHSRDRGGQRRLVLDALIARGEYGATTDELSGELSIPISTASARLTELRQAGAIIRSGRKRPTSTGTPAHVLIVAAATPHRGATDQQKTVEDGDEHDRGDEDADEHDGDAANLAEPPNAISTPRERLSAAQGGHIDA